MVEVRTPEPSSSYLVPEPAPAPAAVVEVRAPSSSYGLPEPVAAPAAPVVEVVKAAPPATGYTAEAAESAPVSTAYGAPVQVEEVAPLPPPPEAPAVIVSRVEPVPAASVPLQVTSSTRNSYAAPIQRTAAVYTVPVTAASTRSSVRVTKPVAILRSVYNAPGTLGYERTFDYAFEAENGIRQEAYGELRTVGESEVVVMKGSYQYVGADGEDYQVNWYADETGYHADAVHLPKNVPIPFPEVQQAVDAQIRFAAEERAANARAAAASQTYATSVPAPRKPTYQ